MADMTPERLRGEWPPKRTLKSIVATIVLSVLAILAGAIGAYLLSPGFRYAVDSVLTGS